MVSLSTERPLVRPRVFYPGTNEPVLLEDVVRADLQTAAHPQSICIYGPPGSGKSTAVQYLRARLKPDFTIAVADDDGSAAGNRLRTARPGEAGAPHQCVLQTSEASPKEDSTIRSYKLCHWGQDDLIEYLLSVSPQTCRSVMNRLANDPHAGTLGGSPFLWSLVLDRMIDDESIFDTRQILRRVIDELLTEDLKSQLGEACRDSALFSGPWKSPARDLQHAIPEARLTRFHPIRLYLAASAIVMDVASGPSQKRWRIDAARSAWTRPWPVDFLQEVYELSDQAVAVRLKWVVAQEKTHKIQPTVASLLVRLVPDWKPGDIEPQNLQSAQLQSVNWPGVSFSHRTIDGANFSDANLSNSKFSRLTLGGVTFHKTNFTLATFQKARATNCEFDGSNFHQADLHQMKLSRCSVRDACFDQAAVDVTVFNYCDLRDANFNQANLRHTAFKNCDLTGAVFTEANLHGADILSPIDGADFRKASLREAKLQGQLNQADFRDADFTAAVLVGCNMEDMQLDAPVFKYALLSETLLTGTRFSNANFRDAKLRGCGLADIEWEGANLRRADLRECTFHLGTTRSGILNSPIASEGTRTGFYTDSWHEQSYKPVEEIRKANLRGADLRAAKLDGVDFYLVDLRDAQYDEKYHQHLVKCGAIL